MAVKVKAAIRGAGRSVLMDALKNRKDFSTSGALLGERSHDGYSHSIGGMLNSNELARLKNDEGRIAYTVFSYASPIAWVLRDGTVYRVEQKFSVTTSKHQGMLYML